jgi:GNAT superfamily N-acetyltransferase
MESQQQSACKIRPLREGDLDAARRIVSLAFGTFIGAPQPENFRTDMDYVTTRWRADPTAAFAAEMDGELVGSNFATRWGSVAFFGPLTVRPDLWDRGVGRQLMDPVMACFDNWNVTHAGLFTFSQSAKHVSLYQKYGFWPRFLTAIVSKDVRPVEVSSSWSKYSDLPSTERGGILRECFRLTDALYPGLNIEREIHAVHAQGLGDTVLLLDGRELRGFAVCHCGPGTEAGDNKCYVKFGAVPAGASSGMLFNRLLDVCEGLAAARGMSRLEAGVNLARHEAYRAMMERGFRTDIQGVAMHRPNEAGYSRPGVYLIDDWR